MSEHIRAFYLFDPDVGRWCWWGSRPPAALLAKPGVRFAMHEFVIYDEDEPAPQPPGDGDAGLKVLFEQEVDGRWIAGVSIVTSVYAYGTSKVEALEAATSALQHVLAANAVAAIEMYKDQP